MTPKALPVSETERDAVAARADKRRAWTGRSGDILTGAEIGKTLDDARAYLAERGWQAAPAATSIFGALDTVGDPDQRSTSLTLLTILIEVRSGTRGGRGDWEAWERRTGRTWPEVWELLTTAAAIARDAGPKGGGGR